MPERVPPFRPGTPLSALRQPLNRLVETANSTVPAPGPAATGQRLPTQLHRIVQMRVLQVGGDWLLCEEWDGVTAGARHYVAKPYKLRRTPFESRRINGLEYSYTTDTERVADGDPWDGSNQETQVVVPAWAVADGASGYGGDLIYAVDDPAGGTAVTDPDSNPVTWLDLNLDGRAWAKKQGT